MLEKLLVVDDEPQELERISRFLEEHGYDVETAQDGAQALALLREQSFALIISDLRMPGVDGLHILREVKDRYPDARFILVTAFATPDSAISALRQGAYDYLTKPLDMGHLLATVRRALEHRSLALQNKRLIEFLREKNLVLEYLHQEEKRKLEQLRQVNAIARCITAILDTEKLVETVVRLVGQAFDFERFWFGLTDPTQDTVLFPGQKLPPALGGGDRLEGLSAGAIWRLTRGGHEPFIRATSADEGSQAPCDLIFPLRAGSSQVPMGFWLADWEEGSGFSPGDLPYLESLAAQTVVVLENARLYALARKADELAFLNEVGRAANQSLDLEDTIRSVLRCVRATFNAALAEICLFAPHSSDIQHVFSLLSGSFIHRSSDGGDSPSSLLGDDFVRRVGPSSIDDGHPHAVHDLTLRSRLGVPMHFSGRRVGVLGVGSTEAEAYGVDDARLLEVVGGQVATAIENARLFQEVESGRRVILRSRNTLQTLFDGILEGICIVDRNYKVLAVNRTQARWAGLGFRELVGGPAERVFPTSKCALELIEETFRTGRPMSRTDRRRSADEQADSVGWREWEIRTYPILGPPSSADRGNREGEVEQVVVMVRDVTEQRLLEASLLQSEKLAAIGQLAAGVAHEINNPMTVISANVQILRDEMAPDHPFYNSIELIDRAVARASKIVRNLLDFSRSEQFGQRLGGEFVPVDLALSLREAASLVEPQLRQADVQIIVELDPDLPPVWGVPDQLHVVWLNLLINARDAIEETRRPGTIHITARRHDEWVTVHVADDGIGMSEQVLKRIYDPFFTTKAPGKGTGLGLFTCYRTILRHGGKITVDSQVGEGTVFHVSLPIHGLVACPV